MTFPFDIEIGSSSQLEESAAMTPKARSEGVSIQELAQNSSSLVRCRMYKSWSEVVKAKKQ